jgi:hypothetical protein
VVERWRTIDDGARLEWITVDDPDTYYEPWSAMHRFRRADQPHYEVCAENNQHLFDYNIPQAKKAVSERFRKCRVN